MGLAGQVPELWCLATKLLAASAWLLYFILDISKAPWRVSLGCGLGVFLLSLVAVTCGLDFPWAIPFLCIQSSFLMCGLMRVYLFESLPSKDFFTASAMSFCICSASVLTLWTGWWISSEVSEFPPALTSKLPDWADNVVNYTLCEADAASQADAIGACSKVNSLVQLQSLSPLAVSLAYGVFALCCTFMLKADSCIKPRLADGLALSAAELKAAQKLQRIVQRMFLLLALVLALGYGLACTSSYAHWCSKLVIWYVLSGVGTILGLIFLETDRALLQRLMLQSGFGKMVLQVLRNDWARAFALGALNVLIPAVLFLDVLRQLVRRSTDPDADSDRLTPMGRSLLDSLKQWNWTGIFRKLDLYCFLWQLVFLGSKCTYVCLSWLNYFLIDADLQLPSVAGMVFLVGVAMFMVPIVPGTAVYLFSGVVLGVLSTVRGLNLLAGIGLGVAVSAVAKHLACVGQYLIGYVAGKWVHVQRLVAVDKVPTRAMEMILNRRGFSLGKVCILVAGPDWPTSVLCGILKLNIPQMLLGTLPVILVSIIPQVAVGALLALPDEAPNVSAGVTMLASILQVGATIYVSYRILKTAEEHFKDLSEPRPEHAEVAELSRKEECFNRRYLETCSWGKLPLSLRLGIFMTSATCFSVCTIQAMDFLTVSRCFRSFSITDRIEESLDKGGLGGNVLNIIQPWGAATLWGALAAVCAHLLCGCALRRLARHVELQVDPLEAMIRSAGGSGAAKTMYEALVGATLLAATGPAILVIALYSGIGLSSYVCSWVVELSATYFPAVTKCLIIAAWVLCFLFDVVKAPSGVFLGTSAGVFGLTVLGLTMMCFEFPLAAPYVAMQSSFLIGCYMRTHLFTAVPSKDFFTASALSYSICGVCALTLWLGWRISMVNRFQEGTEAAIMDINEAVVKHAASEFGLNSSFTFSSCRESSPTDLPDAQIAGACAKLFNVLRLQIYSPVMVPLTYGMVAVCCVFMLNADTMKASKVREGSLSAAEVQAARGLQGILRRMFLVLAVAAALAYGMSYFSSHGSHVTRMMFTYALGCGLTICGIVLLETDKALVQRLLLQTRLGKMLRMVIANDWVRAFACGLFNGVAPAFFLLDALRQLVRVKFRKDLPEGYDREDRFTPAGRSLANWLKQWNWTGILRKLDLFCFLWQLLFIGAKATYVSLSWLNYWLIDADLKLPALTGMVFLVGLAMFMLPIVPGTAVYLFSGVVLGFQTTVKGHGLALGIGLAVAVSSVAKHLACVGQYLIGYFAGKSVRVQRFVAVDKVPTRAMEMILSRRGLSLGKVCILVAGPDFPTSVVCGILKLNIPQMLLGTSPVILISIIPQVAVGALLALPNDAEFSGAVTFVAAVLQVGASVYVSYSLLKTAEENFAELCKVREEHQHVAELTQQEESYTRRYLETCCWSKLPLYLRICILLTSFGCFLVSIILAVDFLALARSFRSFSMTDRIEAPVEHGGLDGNVLNVIVQPWGYATLALAFAAALLHVLAGCLLHRATRRSLDLRVGSIDFEEVSRSEGLAKQAPKQVSVVVRYQE
ncbi:unnamed protein product [Effrenium voratum]|nr:unnamed protein product [Effrenium voratum]